MRHFACDATVVTHYRVYATGVVLQWLGIFTDHTEPMVRIGVMRCLLTSPIVLPLCAGLGRERPESEEERRLGKVKNSPAEAAEEAQECRGESKRRGCRGDSCGHRLRSTERD